MKFCSFIIEWVYEFPYMSISSYMCLCIISVFFAHELIANKLKCQQTECDDSVSISIKSYG